MDLAQFIQACDDVPDVTQLYALFGRALEDLCGYDRVVFSLVSNHPSLDLRAQHGLMCTYPEDWMSHYAMCNYASIDPVKSFGISARRAFSWHEVLLQMPLTRTQRLCMDECQAASLYGGAAVGMWGPNGEVGGLGVAKSTRGAPESAKETAFKLSMLNILSHYFYITFCSLSQPENHPVAPTISLTPKENIVLQKIALGQKDDTVAQEMNISKYAVDFHVRHILKKFNSTNRVSAVVKALKGGYLDIKTCESPLFHVSPRVEK